MGINRSPRRWLIPKVALVSLALAVSLASAQTGPVQYGYDELGRLVIVADGAGNAAIYNYDAVGNLLSIQRIDPGQLGAIAIVKITPTQGKVGSAVSIFGKGFGATPAQNTVSFSGGAAATVTSASPTMLRVTVPSAAVDGPISVTAAAGTATSAQSFRVVGPLTVAPNGTSISAAASLQFSAAGPGGSFPPVTWGVNDVPGGNASVGTISAAGLYAAPPYVNQQSTFTITATDQSDVTAKGSGTATIVPRLVATAQGVSVSVGPQTVSNSLQKSVSVVIGGTTVTKSLQTSVSAVIGGTAIANSLQTAVSVKVGGDPSATAATAVSVGVGPVITGVSPAAGARGAVNLTVTLTGAGFNDATQVTFLRNNAADTTISPVFTSVSPDGTQATLSIAIASGAATGARVVDITTPAGTSTVVGTGANVFTVQ